MVSSQWSLVRFQFSAFAMVSKPKPRLLFVGGCPPPFIGPFLANERLLQSPALNEAFHVRWLDTSRQSVANMGHLGLKNLGRGFWQILLGLVALIRFRPCVVYLNISQELWPYLRDLGLILPAALGRRRLVLHLRGSEFPEFYGRLPALIRWLTRWVLQRTARFIVLGEGIRQRMATLLPVERIRVVPNGINYHEFDVVAAALERQPVAEPQVLFLSSLRQRKGIFQFLAAVPLIRRQHPKATFTVAGEWRQASEREQALAFIAANQLQDCVRFVGVVTGQDKLRLYLEHHLFVFTPLEPEGLPWVILEAMSASLPVVTSDQGAIREVVQDGQTGFIVRPTGDQIAEKVCQLLGNAAAMRTMGLAGRKLVERSYSEEAYVRRITATLLEAALPWPMPAELADQAVLLPPVQK